MGIIGRCRLKLRIRRMERAPILEMVKGAPMAKQWPRTWAGRRIGWGYNDRRDLSQQWWVPAKGLECSFGTALDWMLLLDHSDRRMRCWTSTRWFMTKALIGWNSPPTSHRRLGLVPSWSWSSRLAYFIDLLWTQVTPEKNHRSMFLTSAPIATCRHCLLHRPVADSAHLETLPGTRRPTKAIKSPVGHIYIKVETWLETPPCPFFSLGPPSIFKAQPCSKLFFRIQPLAETSKPSPPIHLR